MQNNNQITLAQIAAALGQSSPADAGKVITGVNSLADARPTEITFLASEQYLKELQHTKAACVLVGRKINLSPQNTVPVMRVDNVDLAMIKVLQLFAPPAQQVTPGVDSSARIGANCRIPPDAAIGACAVLGNNVTLGARCRLHPGVILGDGVVLGEDCELFPNVVIRERVTLGNRVTIHAGSVLGSDGFGYQWDGKQHVKVPQIGTVVVEDDVELGSCVCVDRAKFGATVIGRGTKVDNLVQIAHNVKTGPHCIMAGQTGIAGSTTLGAGVVLGGASSVRDHVTIGDGAMVAARSAVHENIPPKTIVSGMPALPHRQSLREQAAFRKLPELMVQLRKFQEQIEQYMKAQGSSTDDVLGT